MITKDTKQTDKKSTGLSSFKPLLCHQFDIKRFSYTEFDRNNKLIKTQMIAYSRYNYPDRGEASFVFQTPEIRITQYGLPRISEFYPTDDKRNFIKVPFDPHQNECLILEKMLREIDTYTASQKKELFGKFANAYTYQPIIREPATDQIDLVEDDSEDSENPKNKKEDGSIKENKQEFFKYCKMKLSISYPEKIIQTKVYIKGKDKKVEQVSVKTASDLEEYIKFGSKIRFIAMINKLWAQKNKNDAGVRKYGVSIKIIQMEIELPDKTSIHEAFNKYAFQNENENKNENDESNDLSTKESTDVTKEKFNNSSNTNNDVNNEINKDETNKDETNKKVKQEIDQEAYQESNQEVKEKSDQKESKEELNKESKEESKEDSNEESKEDSREDSDDESKDDSKEESNNESYEETVAKPTKITKEELMEKTNEKEERNKKNNTSLKKTKLQQKSLQKNVKSKYSYN